MFSTLALTWIALSIAGQWSMILLLGTYASVQDLPGRRNPFLINLLLTTFLATIPPCLLFYTGQQGGVPTHWICVTQSILLDSVAPMFGVAFVILVFQTWAELRAIIWNDKYMIATSPWARWTLLSIPYVALAGWCTASLIQALSPTSSFQLSAFVYCANITPPRGQPIREKVGPFMIVCGIIEIVFEFLIGFLVLPQSKLNSRTRDVSSASYRESFHMYLRICLFTFLQLGPVFLAVMNKLSSTKSDQVSITTQVLESSDALATFFVFGTQKAVLQSWKILKRSVIESEPKNVITAAVV